MPPVPHIVPLFSPAGVGDSRPELGSPLGPSLLGQKGAGLLTMRRLGLPVPPGFVLTTELCRLLPLQSPQSDICVQGAQDAREAALWAEVDAALHELLAQAAA